MIKPTIGRIVWYWDTLKQRNEVQQGAQARAAIVTFVWDDKMVNLALFRHTGEVAALTSVQLYQGIGKPPTERFCEWMPYQKGKAAQVEAGLDSAGLAARIVQLENQLAQLTSERLAQVQDDPQINRELPPQIAREV